MPIPCHETKVSFEPSPDFELANCVHAWIIDIVPGDVLSPLLTALLSDEEKKRAARFVFDRDRLSYTLAHGALRTILGKYLGLPPAQIRFDVSKSGKPRLSDNDVPLHFNLSHSGNKVLMAISEMEIGADIEQIRMDRNYREVAARYYTPGENLAMTSSENPASVFYTLWSAKEAVVKASGAGLFAPFEEIKMGAGAGDALLYSFPVDGQYRGSIYPVRGGQELKFFRLQSLSQFL